MAKIVPPQISDCIRNRYKPYDISDSWKDLIEMAQNQWQTNQTSVLKPNIPYTNTDIDSLKNTDIDSLKNAILTRMRKPLPCMYWGPVFIPAKSKVVVFIVHNNEPTYIEDDWDMFPSDAFITKLRLLLG